MKKQFKQKRGNLQIYPLMHVQDRNKYVSFNLKEGVYIEISNIGNN